METHRFLKQVCQILRKNKRMGLYLLEKLLPVDERSYQFLKVSRNILRKKDST